jgi:excisionase family DNA binding protein
MPSPRSNRRPPMKMGRRPTSKDATLARESGKRLAKHASGSLRIRVSGAGSGEVEIPAVAVKLLLQVLSEVGQGNSVVVVPVHAELTTQRAADLLGVSRPFLVELLDSGSMPSHRVGTHRRAQGFRRDRLPRANSAHAQGRAR